LGRTTTLNAEYALAACRLLFEGESKGRTVEALSIAPKSTAQWSLWARLEGLEADVFRRLLRLALGARLVLRMNERNPGTYNDSQLALAREIGEALFAPGPKRRELLLPLLEALEDEGPGMPDELDAVLDIIHVARLRKRGRSTKRDAELEQALAEQPEFADGLFGTPRERRGRPRKKEN